MNNRRCVTSVCLILSFLLAVPLCASATETDTRIDKELAGKKIAFLIGDGFHDAETMFPLGFFQNMGAEITVIGVEYAVYTAYNSGISATIEKVISEVSTSDFDAVVIPGGRSPAYLREHTIAVDFLRDFIESGKPVAAICHGPQMIVATGIVEGRTMTAVGGIENEILEAGAIFVDEEVMIDGNLITSRTPPDIPAFSIALSNMLK